MKVINIRFVRTLFERVLIFFKKENGFQHPDYYMEAKKLGISSIQRYPKIIVSLTSYPERIKTIHFTLNTLLNQSLKPDMLILWLANEQFPGKEKDIPRKVLKLKKYGLSIKWCNDIKSHKKLIPSLINFPKDIIVTADDDIYYPLNWLELLYESYCKQPEIIHCHRAHRIRFDNLNDVLPYKQWERNTLNNHVSFLTFLTGGGGALFPPKSLHSDVLKENLFMKITPYGDDIWFWTMAVLNGTKAKLIEKNIANINVIKGTQAIGLWETINNTGNFDIEFKNILKQYKDLKFFLLQEIKQKE